MQSIHPRYDAAISSSSGRVYTHSLAALQNSVLPLSKLTLNLSICLRIWPYRLLAPVQEQPVIICQKLSKSYSNVFTSFCTYCILHAAHTKRIAHRDRCQRTRRDRHRSLCNHKCARRVQRRRVLRGRDLCRRESHHGRILCQARLVHVRDPAAGTGISGIAIGDGVLIRRASGAAGDGGCNRRREGAGHAGDGEAIGVVDDLATLRSCGNDFDVTERHLDVSCLMRDASVSPSRRI